MSTFTHVAWTSTVFCLLSANTAYCQEVVSAEPLSKKEIVATLPVLAVRKVPIDMVIMGVKSPSEFWNMDPTVVVGSAFSSQPKQKKQWDELNSKMSSGDRSAQLSWMKENSSGVAKAIVEWVDTYDNKAGLILAAKQDFSYQDDKIRKSKLNAILDTDNSGAKTISVFSFKGKKQPEQIDPEAIGYILAMNKRMNNGVNNSAIDISPLSQVVDTSLDTNFALNLRQAYYPMTSITASSSDFEKIAAVSNGVQFASSDLPTAVSLLLREGDAGIGLPLIFTSSEKNLKVEPSLLRTYDIYWLQLAVSPSEDLVDRSTELRYDVSVETPNCMVMSLVPVRVGTEVNTSDKINTPSVKVGEVEVGEMFSRSIE